MENIQKVRYNVYNPENIKTEEIIKKEVEVEVNEYKEEDEKCINAEFILLDQFSNEVPNFEHPSQIDEFMINYARRWSARTNPKNILYLFMKNNGWMALYKPWTRSYSEFLSSDESFDDYYFYSSEPLQWNNAMGEEINYDLLTKVPAFGNKFAYLPLFKLKINNNNEYKLYGDILTFPVAYIHLHHNTYISKIENEKMNYNKNQKIMNKKMEVKIEESPLLDKSFCDQCLMPDVRNTNNKKHKYYGKIAKLDKPEPDTYQKISVLLKLSAHSCCFQIYGKRCNIKLLVSGSPYCFNHARLPQIIKSNKYLERYDFSIIDPRSDKDLYMQRLPVLLKNSDVSCVFEKYGKRCTNHLLVSGSPYCYTHAQKPNVMKNNELLERYDYSIIDPNSDKEIVITKYPVLLKNSTEQCCRKTPTGRQCRSKLLVCGTQYCLVHIKSEYEKIKSIYPWLENCNLDAIDPNSETEIIEQKVPDKKMTPEAKQDLIVRFKWFGSQCLLFDPNNRSYRMKPSILYRVFMQYMSDVGYPVNITPSTFYSYIKNSEIYTYIPQVTLHGHVFYTNIKFNAYIEQKYYSVIVNLN